MTSQVVPVKIDTFIDLVNMSLARAKVSSARERDVNLMKGFVNEHMVTVGNHKNWRWRSFDRTIVFSTPVTTGTASVANGNREVTISGLTLDTTYLGRSIRIDGKQNLYRIVGIDVSANKIYLDSNYIDTTDAAATYNIYQYEFALAPDCDVINQVFVHNSYSSSMSIGGELEPITNPVFNRYLSAGESVGVPRAWCRNGKINYEAAVPLGSFLLSYDFLGGDITDNVDRLRIFPIAPDRQTAIQYNYSIKIEPLTADDAKIVMPADDVWCIVHYAVMSWHALQGNIEDAASSKTLGDAIFKKMANEYHKTDSNPTMFNDMGRHRRTHSYNRNKDLFYRSRIGEASD